MITRSDVRTLVLDEILPRVSGEIEAYVARTEGWDDDPPESFIQVAIANAFADCGCKPAMEVWVDDVLTYSCASRKGRKNRDSPAGRFDVVLFEGLPKTPKPVVLIEVKRAWDSAAVEADLRRLSNVCARKGHRKIGLLFVYTSYDGEEGDSPLTGCDEVFCEMVLDYEGFMERLDDDTAHVWPGDPYSGWAVAAFMVT